MALTLQQKQSSTFYGVRDSNERKFGQFMVYANKRGTTVERDAFSKMDMEKITSEFCDLWYEFCDQYELGNEEIEERVVAQLREAIEAVGNIKLVGTAEAHRASVYIGSALSDLAQWAYRLDTE